MLEIAEITSEMALIYIYRNGKFLCERNTLQKINLSINKTFLLTFL